MSSQRLHTALACLTLSFIAAGCSSLQPEAGKPDERAAASGACHAESVQWAIGQEATQDTMGRVWRESHAGLIRPISPGQAVTMDYRPDRVNVELDASNRIARIHCG